MNRLILTGLNQSYEQQPYLARQDLTFNTLEQSLIKHLGIEKLSKDILLKLELISSSGEYNNATALLADNNTFIGIDLVRFGEDVNIFLDRETHEKTSILIQYENAISMFKKYYQYEKIEGFSRKTIELVPEEAFREAIANALIHRTWDVPAHIRISMFKDRIEITSPGGLPNNMTEEYYLNGQISSLRNPNIANVFFRLKYIENLEQGLEESIILTKTTILNQFIMFQTPRFVPCLAHHKQTVAISTTVCLSPIICLRINQGNVAVASQRRHSSP